jgi:hypothetical protein
MRTCMVSKNRQHKSFIPALVGSLSVWYTRSNKAAPRSWCKECRNDRPLPFVRRCASALAQHLRGQLQEWMFRASPPVTAQFFFLTCPQFSCYARNVLIREQYSVYLLIVRKRKQSMSCSTAIVTKLIRKRSFRTQGASCDSTCTVAQGRTMPFFREDVGTKLEIT